MSKITEFTWRSRDLKQYVKKASPLYVPVCKVRGALVHATRKLFGLSMIASMNPQICGAPGDVAHRCTLVSAAEPQHCSKSASASALSTAKRNRSISIWKDWTKFKHLTVYQFFVIPWGA